jgi:hypothetical protein
MSFGDPFEKFYKDDIDDRKKHLILHGCTPGAIAIMGMGCKPATTLHAWSGPGYEMPEISVQRGIAVILTVDCESDPVETWLQLLLSTAGRQFICWCPMGVVRLIAQTHESLSDNLVSA